MSYLTTNPISWERIAHLERLAVQQGCGALVTFVGIVRGDRDGDRTVNALYYEAYAEMTERQIDRLVAEARARWPLDSVQIQHRLGFVAVGQISVVTVVGTQHRTGAYAASQFLIERLKHEAPIWKREHYDNGITQWAMCRHETLSVADPSGAVYAHL